MKVAIVNQTVASGVVVVEEFRDAASTAAAVSAFVNEYTPPKTAGDYLGFDTGWGSYQRASAGCRWGYDFDGAPAGLVDVAVPESYSVNGGRFYYNRALVDVYPIASVGGVLTIDCVNGAEQRAELTEDITVVEVINKPASGLRTRINVTLVQGATARAIPAAFYGIDKWVNTDGGPVMPATEGAELRLMLDIYDIDHMSYGGWVSSGAVVADRIAAEAGASLALRHRGDQITEGTPPDITTELDMVGDADLDTTTYGKPHAVTLRGLPAVRYNGPTRDTIEGGCSAFIEQGDLFSFSLAVQLEAVDAVRLWMAIATGYSGFLLIDITAAGYVKASCHTVTGGNLTVTSTAVLAADTEYIITARLMSDRLVLRVGGVDYTSAIGAHGGFKDDCYHCKSGPDGISPGVYACWEVVGQVNPSDVQADGVLAALAAKYGGVA